MDLQDITISGSGSIGKGNYKEVKISGSCKTLGDITAESVKISGSLKAEGAVKAEEVKVSGSASFSKDMEAGELKVSGSVKVEDKIKCGQGVLNGSVKCKIIEGESVTVNGIITGCEEINADEIHLGIGRTYINQLHADHIEIRLPAHGLFWRSFEVPEFDEIDCTDIKAEGMKCKKLCCKDCDLGEFCEIEYLEYSGIANIQCKNKIKNINKI